jgi:hypothetical protein
LILAGSNSASRGDPSNAQRYALTVLRNAPAI